MVSPGDVSEVADQLREAELPHKAAIESAIAAYLAHEDAVFPGDTATYLSIRVLTLMTFASDHLVEGNTELFPPIPKPHDEAILWLLTDWWYARGHYRAAQWLTEHQSPIEPAGDDPEVVPE